jgi:ribosome modulation factor
MSDYRRNQAFQAGRKAALAGKTKETCNRQPGTIFFDDWHDGFEEVTQQLPEESR